MTPKSAIQKGKELENYVSEQMRLKGIDAKARREIGSGSGKFKGDISTDIGWTIECKNTKRFDWASAAEQVRRESMGYQKEVIIWHPPQRPMADSVAIISLEDWFEFIKLKKAGLNKDDILDKREVKYNLERAVSHLKQVVKNLE